jgi:hypothetical protein
VKFVFAEKRTFKSDKISDLNSLKCQEEILTLCRSQWRGRGPWGPCLFPSPTPSDFEELKSENRQSIAKELAPDF